MSNRMNKETESLRKHKRPNRPIFFSSGKCEVCKGDVGVITVGQKVYGQVVPDQVPGIVAEYADKETKIEWRLVD